jgi:PAS domain S-box-containing protein
MPKNKYYHNINYMTKMLIIFSVIFLFVYAIISIRFIRAREKEKMNVIIREKNLKLEETAHWYKSILDAVPLPISVTNVKTEWVFVNKATVNFLGVKQEDIMGKLCNLWKSDICNTENCGIECIKKGIKRTYFTQNDLSFQVDTEILRDLHGEVSGYVEIVQDITEVQEMARKQANAEESDRLKSAFLANMSHEIRTPLNAIVGFSHLLVSKNYDEEKRQTFLSRIKSNSNQLLVIIEDVLDISKIESGQLTLNYEWIDLNALLQEILEDMQLHIQDKDIALFCQKSLPDAEVHIKVDNVRLKQVLTNLILNAIKFTTQGFINFGYVQKDTMLEFFVKDSGIGIAKENQKQIFEYFRQEDESTTRKFGGNGLGLSIAKQLVELMGGKIRVESEKDKGATFFFTIPYIVSQQSHALMVVPPEEKKLNKQHIIPKITITDKKILIVDDVDSTFILISEILSKYNVNLHHVDRGEKSVEFVKENPDTTIIFMDIHMPGITGVEAMKLIKAINPDIPIVAQTAFAMKEDKEKFIKEGFDGYITKPLQESDLLKIFKRFFMQ